MMDKNELPLVSIVTINYNGFSDTCEMIDSLKKFLSVSYEIIVVDNHSLNDEGVQIQAIYPDVKVVLSSVNLGFAGGNNLGIKECRGIYVLLLNNDTLITDDSIRYLVECFNQNPLLGGVSPKLYFNDPPYNVQFAGCTNLSKITLRNRQIGYNLPDDEKYDLPMAIPYLHGAAMMIPKKVIDEVGLMPDIYFLYYEELDYSNMIKRAGYQLWYEPRCVIYHKESRSTGYGSPFRSYYLTRNRLLFTVRNYSGLERILSLLYQTLFVIPTHSAKFILIGKPKHAVSLFKAFFDFIPYLYKEKGLKSID